MNLIEILKNNNYIVLAEAVRVNNGKEAYELIKSNRIGVKLDPSYKSADESIIPYFDKVINDVGANNAPFAIQLLANKVPVGSLGSATSGKTLKEIVACKNKPWAKQISSFKEIINFSSKEKYDQSKWDNLATILKAESKNHGKANKGGGELEDVKELYNDGTWTLQVPTSWNGAKAASFYGKEGEKPKPCNWCTRANESQYDAYTEYNKSPLYIIKNSKEGKAYQMAIRGDKVDFLDQNDEKGDEITHGNFKNIPDGLLKKIPYGDGESMYDFKKSIGNAYNEVEEYKKNLKNVRDRSKLKDPANTLDKARWGETEKVNNKVSKNVMLNFMNAKPVKIENPFDNNKFGSINLPKKINSNSNQKDWKSGFISGDKVNSFRNNGKAVKYYYNDNPNNFILVIALSGKSNHQKYSDFESLKKSIFDKNNTTNYQIKTYINNVDASDSVSKRGENADISLPEFNYKHSDLVDIALKDFGINKTYERNAKEDGKNEKEAKAMLASIIINEMNPLLKEVSPEEKFFVNTHFLLAHYVHGEFLLSNGVDLEIKNNVNDKCVKILSFDESAKKINMVKPSGSGIFVEPETFRREIDKKMGYDNFKRKASELLNKAYKKYALSMIKDKKLKNARINQRGKVEKSKEPVSDIAARRLQFEDFTPNYFPY